MAFKALPSVPYSFIHNLKSVFWVLFWISVYFNGSNESKAVLWFEKWNYVDMEELASDKKGVIS